MLIVDSHVHIGVNWGEPADVMIYQMDANKVAHAVLVAHNGNYDNSYLFDSVKEYEGRFTVVGMVDLNAADCIAALAALRKQGGAGIRINLRKENEWSPDNAAFKAAGDLGLVISVIGKAENFASAAFRKLLDNFPGTHFCLEHLCRSPGGDVAKPPYDVFEKALECARWDNTSIKVPGLGEIVGKPHILPKGYPWGNDIPPHYEMAFKAFGPKRMMWGSNFPPSAAKEGYRNALEGVRKMPMFQNGDDLAWVMGKTAAKLWGLPV